MKTLKHTITAVISRGEKLLVAECVEINVVTQGNTMDEVITNLQEAVALHFEGEDHEEMGFVKNPALVVTMEIEPAYAA